MKINWGTKLAFFAIAFMVFVISMVVIISREDMPLVDQNYYEKGLNYQQEIDNQSQVDSLVQMEIVEDQIYLTGNNVKGTLSFYRASDPNLDKSLSTLLMPGKREVYSMKDLQSGKWKIKFTWEKEGKTYFRELETER